MVFGAVLSPSPFSPMWWMGVFYGIYLVFLGIEVWSIFSNHWGIHRYACMLSSVTAVVAPTTLGAVFAVLGARPYWHGAFTPPAWSRWRCSRAPPSWGSSSRWWCATGSSATSGP